ncbi:alpha-L-fucosidase [Algibacter lectus]|uniref:alpha-L-fucosidase n=1 Tax=Algibacter lectus TaxID=221126 RepID=A0A090WY78_9FLAO|nr:alpha-L-fucosidase [Algibacter lectus]GAL82040.1 alpha-L-fucosidase [Algibacter lectus]
MLKLKKVKVIIIAIIGLSLNACITDSSKQEITSNKTSEAYEPTWESLSNHKETPEWFADAKMGIYFTWGVYSVPAYYSEWYPYFMYRKDGHPVEVYHREKYGDPKDFNYHDFVPKFTAEHFDAQNWAALFKDAGAKFAGPCAQHHDGFALWDSKVNPWNSLDKGPKQDLTGELGKAIKSEGLKFITTFHHARNAQRYASDPEHWGGYNSHFTYNPEYATASTDPEIAKLYGNIPEDEFNEYWFQQLKEVIDQYSPDIVWFDSWLNLIPEKHRQEFAAYYLNEAKKKNQEVVIAYKQNDLPKNLGVLDIEQGGKKDISESVWLTDVTLSNNSWSYVEEQTYKPAELVVRNMIDVWSKNGIVLLNCSPKANGIIPPEQRTILRNIGQWMRKHSEAVYETRPFDFYGFGDAKATDGHFGGQSATIEYTAQDGRFLKSKDGKFLYLFMLGKPEIGDKIEIRGLAKHDFYPEKGFKKITIMGSDVEAKWHFALRNFILTVPDSEMDDIATVFKIELN